MLNFVGMSLSSENIHSRLKYKFTARYKYKFTARQDRNSLLAVFPLPPSQDTGERAKGYGSLGYQGLRDQFQMKIEEMDPIPAQKSSSTSDPRQLISSLGYVFYRTLLQAISSDLGRARNNVK